MNSDQGRVIGRVERVSSLHGSRPDDREKTHLGWKELLRLAVPEVRGVGIPIDTSTGGSIARVADGVTDKVGY
jgi:hypothetical protein